jgi:lipoprotein-releasing system permease protein
VHIDDASALKGLGGRPEGLALRLTDPMLAPAVEQRIAGRLAPGQVATSWTDQHRSIFRAIRIEKIMMTVILMFIVAVAAFNIVASLMMVVTDKERDIAILRTCGIEPDRVARIFLVQGSILGLVGAATGTALGLVLAANVGVIVPWLESTFGFQIMPGDLYYVTAIPSEIHAGQVAVVPLLALAFAVLATVYPSRRAAGVAPAHALRYD